MSSTATTETPAAYHSAAVLEIPLDRIRAGDNLRAAMGLSEPDGAELVASIKSVGILEPVLVEPAADDGTYRLIAGHRRHAGAVLAKLPTIPAIVRDGLGAYGATVAMLVENLQRADLAPLEEASGYARLIARGLTQKEIAAQVGRSQAHISKRLGLLKLPADVQEKIGRGIDLEAALELVDFADDRAVLDALLAEIADARRRGWQLNIRSAGKQAREQQARAAARAEAEAKLRAAKVSVLKTDEYGRPPHLVHELGKGWGKIPLSVAEHSKQPCHAAYVAADAAVRYVCTKPANHAKDTTAAVRTAVAEIAGKRGDAKDNAARKEKAAASRIRNKGLAEREPLRQKALGSMLRRRVTGPAVVDFTVRQLLQLVLGRHPELGRVGAEFVGVKVPDNGEPAYAAFVAGRPAKALELAYAVALASGELPFRLYRERGYFDAELAPNAARYLAHLEGSGYEPAKVETASVRIDSWRPAFDRAPAKKPARRKAAK